MNKELKKKVFIGVAFPLGLLFLCALYLFVTFPSAELRGLGEGFVKMAKNEEGKVSFEVTDERPSDWVELGQVSPFAAKAIVVSEDWSFYNHNGYDPKQIKEAVNEAIEGERTRGASTISQQVIKNIFLTPEKTLSRKFKELLYSTYMEKNVSKDKILETYLNIAEFAPGIYGIKAAAKHYFEKSPEKLSAKEGAFLAMLLPSPKRYSQSFRQKEMTEFAEKTVNTILEKMVVANYLPKEELEKVKEDQFHWEKKAIEKAKKEVQKTSFKKKKRKRKKARDLTGKRREANYRVDSELRLDENPEFDEDAIIEDIDGIKAEFNVE